jgi:glycosyltransferase involved in cell wall biosynthesis
MPAKDEGHHIYENLVETARVFEELGYPYEIILIDDGSSDNTFEEALRAASEERPIRLYKCQKNHGKGHALKSGFSVARGDLIAFLDADLDLPPGQFKRLIRTMEEQGADIVIGSKRHPESVVNYPKRRKFLSTAYACFLWGLFGLPLRDTQSGIKLFRREPLDRIFPVVLCKQWAFDVEILANAHHLGYRIVEAPVELHFRREVRWGRVGLRTLFKTGLDTLAIFYRLRILRYYDRALRDEGGAAGPEAAECAVTPDPSVRTRSGGAGVGRDR